LINNFLKEVFFEKLEKLFNLKTKFWGGDLLYISIDDKHLDDLFDGVNREAEYFGLILTD
jgi:hypothetical protein